MEDVTSFLFISPSSTKVMETTVILSIFIIQENFHNPATLVAQDSKASACKAGDPDSIPGLGRSPGEGNGNPLQYSCLENPMMEEPDRLQSVELQIVGHD